MAVTQGGLGKRAMLLATLAVAAFVTAGSGAEAAELPRLLWQVPESGQSGSRAGQLRTPGGVAVDPASGDIFVADEGNARIDEFDPWGQFVKAWGWRVVAAGPDKQPPQNEVQELDVSGVGSSFQVVYLNAFGRQDGQSIGQETQGAPLSSSTASAVAVQEALEGLPSLNPGDVVVSGPNGGPYQIEFTGTYADSDIPPLEAVGAGRSEATTLQGGGSFEVCRAGLDVCQEGQRGGYAPGEFPDLGGGLTLDSSGNIFVHEAVHSEIGIPSGPVEDVNLRVQSFDLEGNFRTMWGGEVDKTTASDICSSTAVEGGDECGAGLPGSALGEFQSPAPGDFGRGIAIGPGGHVFVGDGGRIQEFDSAGTPVSPAIAVAGETVGVVINSQGDFFVTLRSEVDGDAGVKPGIRELSPSGSLLKEIATEGPEELKQIQALAVGADDSLYAAGKPAVSAGALPPPSIIKFSPTGKVEIPAEDSSGERFGEAESIPGLATSNACGIAGEDLYATARPEGEGDVLRAYGPPPDTSLCPPPLKPPAITDQFAASVMPDGAVLRARINPRFWPDTRYRVEYGTGKCSQGGCTLTRPSTEGALLTERVVDAALLTANVSLPTLTPATTYHYRFVAESSGGGPVYGIDPDESGPMEASSEEGLEGTFTTFALPPPPDTSCPNQVFRSGASGRLPDCRAYEMVTPIEKGNADAIALEIAASNTHNVAALDQSAVDGNKFTYGTYRSFDDAISAPYSSQYLATRTSDGWATHGISPPRGHNLLQIIAAADTQFKAFSPDLCKAWVFQDTDALLAPGAVAGFPDLYRRENCEPGTDTYQALTTEEPSGVAPNEDLMELQGVSADGSHAIFIAPDGATKKIALFDAFGSGTMRRVCILPNGKPVAGGCTAGTLSGGLVRNGRRQSVSHAISADGSRIFWSDAGPGEERGRIYVRVNGKKTIPVSEEAESLTGHEGAQYWTAAADGSRAIFQVEDVTQTGSGSADLYEFDVNTQTTSLISHEVFGVMGASEDARRVYFVSKAAMGSGGIAGRPNLYLHEVGKEPIFIATVSEEDAQPTGGHIFSPVSFEAANHTAQVTPSGNQLVFMSTAALKGNDNTDAASGKADAQVFRYDAASGQLACISCNPTGTRPHGQDIGVTGASFWAAGRLPLIQTQLYPISRAISGDGSRVFFESFDRLVPADNNGVQDVYEWEEPGTPGCAENGPSFSPTAEGCVSLISSGEDPINATILDVDPAGNNVFFSTQVSLLPQDPGLVDIYDARVEGGFPPPPNPAPACEGEACQAPTGTPSDPNPASSSFEGAGNVAKPIHKKKHKRHRRHKNRKRHAHGKKGAAR